ncbi:MAG: hypothetical protein GKR97_19345 [Rhizobiaceae bacterium]|nr:hypothetical protein [Rhizobiaceae bacterium]
MYAEDSFFTLSIAGRLGLVAVSLLLSGLTLLLLWYLARGRHLVIRLLLAMIAFSVFVWLSPQLYYLYYLVLFEDLPWQFVIAAPPSPSELGGQLLFQERHNLSYHSRGVLGWIMVVMALLHPRLDQLLAR